jgi:hypothetical protein
LIGPGDTPRLIAIDQVHIHTGNQARLGLVDVFVEYAYYLPQWVAPATISLEWAPGPEGPWTRCDHPVGAAASTGDVWYAASFGFTDPPPRDTWFFRLTLSGVWSWAMPLPEDGDLDNGQSLYFWGTGWDYGNFREFCDTRRRLINQ